MNNHYAQYTQVFLDVMEDNPTFLDDLQLDTNEHTQKFKNALLSKWGIYEIGGETLPQFKLFLKQKFDLWKDYFIEMINAYETKINMLDGNLETITETFNKETNGTGSQNVDNEHSYIDLPNKQTTKEYISNKNKNNGTSDSSYSDNEETTREITRKGRINVIELKRDYMKLIKNVYRDFVDKFEPCFITLFS